MLKRQPARAAAEVQHYSHHQHQEASDAGKGLAGKGAPARPGHDAHGAGRDHSAMVADFRRRFWVSTAISVPVLALSPMIQRFLGLEAALAFPGDAYVLFALSAAVFFYGGWPFLTGLVSELGNRRPLEALVRLLPSTTHRCAPPSTSGRSVFLPLIRWVRVYRKGHLLIGLWVPRHPQFLRASAETNIRA